MIKKILLFIGFLIIIPVAASAGDKTVLHLSDGSVITGKVLSMNAETCRIKTESLGTIEIDRSKIASMKFVSGNQEPVQKSTSSGSGYPDPDTVKAQAASMAKTMLSDRDLSKMVVKLQDDPDFKAVLENPALIRAAQSGDINALLADPDFQKLLQNASVKEISGKLGAE